MIRLATVEYDLWQVFLLSVQTGQWALVVGLLFLLLFVMIGGWIVWHLVFVDRIVVDAAGITCSWQGIRVQVDWTNLSHFRLQRGLYRRPTNDYLAICFQHPVPVRANPVVRLLGISSYFERALTLDYWVNVPHKASFATEIDLPRFQQTPFGRDLLHYAPQVFETEIK